jgi:hypothetical protein
MGEQGAMNKLGDKFTTELLRWVWEQNLPQRENTLVFAITLRRTIEMWAAEHADDDVATDRIIKRVAEILDDLVQVSKERNRTKRRRNRK